MKLNKLTAALAAMGIVSLAGVAQAANPVIYVTGSTAARGTIFNAMTAVGQVFDAGHAGAVVSPAPNNTSSAGLIVYEGLINGVTVDIDCSWTGSEAGIAAVAGQTLTQNVNGGTYALPGVPPSFLTQASGWTTTSTLPIAGGVSVPDLGMADTSQAVSRTPASLFPLTDYGIVGIVTFTFMKGYEATPDASWNNFKNVETGTFNQNLSAGFLYNANNYTGVAADAVDGVAVCGRNLGSGTRVNALLNGQYGIATPVIQYAYDSGYPASSPGVLTFSNNYAASQTLQSFGNDGFDSGGSVAKNLNVDGTGQGIILLGYLGVGDAKSAHSPTATGAGPAQYVTYNGVYEGDTNVIWGSYSYWGQEHLLGTPGQSSTSQAGQVATHIVSGLAAQLTSSGAGTASGDVTSNPSQSALIPKALMQVHRNGDAGFPIQGPF